MHGLSQWFVREWWPGFALVPPAAAGARFGSSDVLLDCRYSRPHRWHVPAAFELGSVGWVARSRVRMLFAPGLLFGGPLSSLGRRRAVAACHCFIPFFATLPCDALSAFLPLRPFVYPCYLSGNRISVFTSPGPGVCGRPDVGCVTFVYLVPAVLIKRNCSHSPAPTIRPLCEVTCLTSRRATGWCRRRGRLKMANGILHCRAGSYGGAASGISFAKSSKRLLGAYQARK